MFKTVLTPTANAFLFVKNKKIKRKEVICSLKNILQKANGSFIGFLVCLFKTKGCNLTLETTSEFSRSFVTSVSLFMFDNLKFISQERNQAQPKTDDRLEFLFCLLYDLCFSPFLLSLATAFLRNLPLQAVSEIILIPGRGTKKFCQPYISLHPTCSEFFFPFFFLFSSNLQVPYCVPSSFAESAEVPSAELSGV